MEQLILHNLKENKTLGNVLKENGINFIDFKKYWVMSNIELIGSGQFGKVFDIGNDKILKISKDIYEYNALIYLKNELILNKNIWCKNFINLPLYICPINENFYEKFDDNDKKDIRYYFIFEKLIKLSDYEIKIFEEIEDFYGTAEFENMNYSEGEESEIENFIKQKYKNFNEYYILNFLINIFKIVDEFNFTDIHIENIMKDKNGNLKIIDLRL